MSETQGFKLNICRGDFQPPRHMACLGSFAAHSWVIWGLCGAALAHAVSRSRETFRVRKFRARFSFGVVGLSWLRLR